MSKFKIGDKVRRTDCEYDNNRGDVILVGEICTVTAVSDDGNYISVNHIADRDDVYPCSADFFKLVEEEQDEVVQGEQDLVNSPLHYQSSSGIECIEAIKAQMSNEEYRGYLRGNVVKYLWRYQQKGGKQSLEKARWYLDKLIGETSGVLEDTE